MVVHGVQLLKRGDISVCSQDTGSLDEKEKTITTGGKEEQDEAKNIRRIPSKSPKSDVQLYLRPLG